MAHTINLKPEPSSGDRGTISSASTYPQQGGPNSKPNSTMLPHAEPGKGLGLPQHPPPSKEWLQPVAGEWKVSPVVMTSSQTWRWELSHHKPHTFVEMLIPSTLPTTNWLTAGPSQQDLPDPSAHPSTQAKNEALLLALHHEAAKGRNT